MTENEAWEIINDYNNFVDGLEDYSQINKARRLALDALYEIQKYREIGTVEECRQAVEKQIPKEMVNIKVCNVYTGGKFIGCGIDRGCPSCKKAVDGRREICPHCGQKLIWVYQPKNEVGEET